MVIEVTQMTRHDCQGVREVQITDFTFRNSVNKNVKKEIREEAPGLVPLPLTCSALGEQQNKLLNQVADCY